jgi:hypothetical protein
MLDSGRGPMKSRFLMAAILATAFCATPTWAWHRSDPQQDAVPDKKTKTPKPSKYDITLTIDGGYGGTGTATATGCSGGEDWADYCISGECLCYTYTGRASGTAGSGAFTFYESYDENSFFAGFEAGCDQAFGDIEINGSKDVESISFWGSDCGSDFTPQYFLSGGCTLEDTSIYSDGAVGQCSGNFNYAASGATLFTISGKALK